MNTENQSEQPNHVPSKKNIPYIKTGYLVSAVILHFLLSLSVEPNLKRNTDIGEIRLISSLYAVPVALHIPSGFI